MTKQEFNMNIYVSMQDRWWAQEKKPNSNTLIDRIRYKYHLSEDREQKVRAWINDQESFNNSISRCFNPGKT